MELQLFHGLYNCAAKGGLCFPERTKSSNASSSLNSMSKSNEVEFGIGDNSKGEPLANGAEIRDHSLELFQNPDSCVHFVEKIESVYLRPMLYLL